MDSEIGVHGKGVGNYHFGGNQLPLYPFFIAMIWFIFGENNQLIVLSKVSLRRLLLFI